MFQESVLNIVKRANSPLLLCTEKFKHSVMTLNEFMQASLASPFLNTFLNI